MTTVGDRDLVLTERVVDSHVDAAAVRAFAAATLDDSGDVPPLYVARLAVPVVTELVAGLLAEAPGPVLHVAQELECTEPLRVGQAVLVRGRVLAIADFGLAPAATVEVSAMPAGAAGPAVTSRSTLLLPGRPRVGRRVPRSRRSTALDLLAETELPLPADLPTRYAAASGDHNPIHIDDVAARAAGLPGVVVHGMCVLAAVSAAVRRLVGRDWLAGVGCRFSRPVAPGESLVVRLFRTAEPDVVAASVTQLGHPVLKDATFSRAGTSPTR